MAEEAGEGLRAALTIIETEEKLVGTRQTASEILLSHSGLAKLEEELVEEMVQTGAMALRWLINYSPVYAEARSEPLS